MKKLITLFLFVAVLALALAGCSSENPPAPTPATATGIEVSAMPTKTTYDEGEFFDASGLVVKKVMSDGAKSIIADYEIDKTAALTVADTQVTITWGEFSATVAITVNAITPPTPPTPVVTLTGLQFKTTEGYVYHRTEPFGENLLYRTVKSDDTFGEWDTLVNNDIKNITIADSKMTVTVEMTLQNTKLTGSFEVDTVAETLTGVGEFLQKDLTDTTTVYNLNGVVVAIASVMRTTSNAEYFIKDKNSDAIVSVLGMLDGDDKTNFYNYTMPTDFVVGDEVVLPVTIAKSGITRESSKIIAKYAGGTFYRTAFVSANNPTALNKSDATLITNQTELADFLSATNRGNNYYKYVKLSGDLNYVAYNTATGGRFSRFYFDESITANAQQYVDSSSPVFLDANTKYSAGTGFIDMMLGGVAASESYSSPSHTAKDIYALYAGSNSYYHQFVILSASDVGEPTAVLQHQEFVAPSKSSYAIGESLDFAGGTVTATYNYKQFNTVTNLAQTHVTANTFDSSTEGSYVVTFTVNGIEYPWNVSVLASVPTAIAVKEMPTKTTYSHREGVKDIDLSGGIITVTFSGGATQDIEMTKDMLPATESENWKVGVVNYTLTYNGITTTLPITFENTAYSVSEFYDASGSGEMDVTGIVMGATSSLQTAELILKDKTTGKLMSIQSISKLIGTVSDVNLDTTKCKVGDEIIIKVTRYVLTGKNAGHIQGKGISGTEGTESYNSVIVVSSGNDASFDLSNAVTIASQQDFINFSNNSNRFLSIVKFTADVKAAVGEYTKRLYLYFGECATADDQKINGNTPVIYFPGCNGIDVQSYFTGFDIPQTGGFKSVGTYSGEFYALFVRNYSATNAFAILDTSWFVAPTV